MKPIEPGALVVLTWALPEFHHLVGNCYVVLSEEFCDGPCVQCGGHYGWVHDGGFESCGCSLIRIDPDAVTEPTEQEITA